MELLQKHLNSLLRKEQVELALICAVCIDGLRKGFNPIQQSDFWSPMGKIAESQEEVYFQDLVHIHRVLPPNDTFNDFLAEKGYYTKLKHRVLDEFWTNYDPEQDKEIKFKKTYTPRPFPVKNKTFHAFKLSNPNKRKLRKLKNV